MNDLKKLRIALTDLFTISELTVLAFDLQIDYEQLKGDDKATRVISLIQFVKNVGNLPDLINAIKESPPQADIGDMIHIMEQAKSKPTNPPETLYPDRPQTKRHRIRLGNYPLKIGDTISSVDETETPYKIHTYRIVKELKGGDRGHTYVAELVDGDQKVVIKIPKVEITRSDEQITRRLEAIYQDTQQEYKAYLRLSESDESLEAVADIHHTGQYTAIINGTYHTIPYIIQEFIDGDTLDEWLLKNFSNADKKFSGITNFKAWFTLAKKVASVVEIIHTQRVVHGDIWPPNIMIKNNIDNPDDYQVVFIDFGQAWFFDRELSIRGTDRIRYAYYAPERISASGLTWYAPADIYALGGILFYLATGQEPPNPMIESQFKAKNVLKAEVITAIKAQNPDLYWQNIGIVDVIMYCLRPKAEERAVHAGAVIELMDIFQESFNKHLITQMPSQEDSIKLISLINKFEGQYIKSLQNKNIWFDKIITRHFRSLIAHIKSSSSRMLIVTGDRDTQLHNLMGVISTLNPNDQCFAVTTSAFWSIENFGTNGRILTMLKMAALHGVVVRWVILITEDEKQQLGVQNILNAHKDAALELNEKGVNIKNANINDSGYYFGYKVISDEEKLGFIREAKSFVILNHKDGEKNNRILVAPTYRQANGSIAVVRYWVNPTRWESDFALTLENRLTTALPIINFTS